MPLRPPAGFILVGYDPLKVPDAPTVGTATAGDAQATVSFTAPANVGGSAITLYGVVAKNSSNNTTISATGSSSPITVSGLTNNTTYTAAVWAINSFGPGPFSSFSNSFTPVPQLGLFGAVGDTSNVIEYINISTLGNSTDFGDLTEPRTAATAFSSSSRGVFAGGLKSGSVESNTMDYVTFSSAGNATDFGDLITVLGYVPGSCASSTRGVVAGGASSSGYENIIQYVTIASVGNATDFGDLAVKTQNLAGCSSSTRGIFAGGFDGVAATYTTNVINYITIATTGNSTDFGDLNNRVQKLAGLSNSTRGVFGGGDIFGTGYTNVIDYITIATTGNATDFGDLLSATAYLAGCAGLTRGIIAGGVSVANVIQYITIATTGNATDFGDLTQVPYYLAACSNSHGGL